MEYKWIGLWMKVWIMNGLMNYEVWINKLMNNEWIKYEWIAVDKKCIDALWMNR